MSRIKTGPLVSPKGGDAVVRILPKFEGFYFCFFCAISSSVGSVRKT